MRAVSTKPMGVPGTCDAWSRGGSTSFHTGGTSLAWDQANNTRTSMEAGCTGGRVLKKRRAMLVLPGYMAARPSPSVSVQSMPWPRHPHQPRGRVVFLGPDAPSGPGASAWAFYPRQEKIARPRGRANTVTMTPACHGFSKLALVNQGRTIFIGLDVKANYRMARRLLCHVYGSPILGLSHYIMAVCSHAHCWYCASRNAHGLRMDSSAAIARHRDRCLQ